MGPRIPGSGQMVVGVVFLVGGVLLIARNPHVHNIVYRHTGLIVGWMFVIIGALAGIAGLFLYWIDRPR